MILPGLLAAAVELRAQEQAKAPSAPDVIATDRAAFSDASVVVPQNGLQFEDGLLEASSHGQSGLDFTETLIRYGVAAKTELRVTVPDYYQRISSGSAFITGFSDLMLGLKQQLGPLPGGFDVSLVLSVSLPTGANEVSSHGYDPSVQLPWTRKLSENWTSGGMLSVFWPTQGPRRNVIGQTTFELDRQLTKPWDAFVEYAGDFPERGGPQHIIHFGTAYKTTPHQQIDFHIGFGLSADAPQRFVGVGYSFLFSHVGK